MDACIHRNYFLCKCKEQSPLIQGMHDIACQLCTMVNLKDFMIHIFLKFCDLFIATCQVMENANDASILRNLNLVLAKQTTNGNLLIKPGLELSKTEYQDIVNYLRSRTKSNLERVKEALDRVSLNQLMGGMYSAVVHYGIFHSIFSVCKKPEFFKRHPHVSYLLETALGTLRKVMALPDSFTSEDFFALTDQDPQQDMFNKTGNRKILLEMLIFGNSPSSIVTMNVNNQEYIRMRRDRSNNSSVEYKRSEQLGKDSCPRYNDGDSYFMVKGDTWYPVPIDSFFHKLFGKYGRDVMAGPSGSTYMWIIFCFHLLRIDRSFTNHVLLLACIIGDFVPYYHSLDEILIVFSRELLQEHPKRMKHYTIDRHPFEWILYYLGKHGMDTRGTDDWGKVLTYIKGLVHTFTSSDCVVSLGGKPIKKQSKTRKLTTRTKSATIQWQ